LDAEIFEQKRGDPLQLALRPKGDKAKIAMAQRLRKETTMSLKWIAARLQMGSWGYVFNLLTTNKSRK
jgi:hypothetical protein